jgi:pyruvate-formate lyase-activating enzyme
LTTIALTDDDLLTPFVDTVLWAVTTNCNLRCTYCAVSLPIYRGEDFDLARAEALAEEFATAKVRMVQISGHGETTMIPGWQAIGHAFTRHDINVCITSNFSKVFSDDELDALARMVHITISIDTVDRELLKNMRRKVDLRTILYNMQLVRLAASKLGREARFNWQCTLSDAVVSGLADWFDLGILNGVKKFTLGNLIEHEGLPDSPRHVAKLGKPQLLAACDRITELARLAHSASAELEIQSGIIEGINESLARYGENQPFALPTFAPDVPPTPPNTKPRTLFERLRDAL